MIKIDGLKTKQMAQNINKIEACCGSLHLVMRNRGVLEACKPILYHFTIIYSHTGSQGRQQWRVKSYIDIDGVILQEGAAVQLRRAVLCWLIADELAPLKSSAVLLYLSVSL